MKQTDIWIRLEKQENIFARCAVMIQRDIERLEERIEALEAKIPVTCDKNVWEGFKTTLCAIDEVLEKKERVDNE